MGRTGNQSNDQHQGKKHNTQANAPDQTLIAIGIACDTASRKDTDYQHHFGHWIQKGFLQSREIDKCGAQGTKHYTNQQSHTQAFQFRRQFFHYSAPPLPCTCLLYTSDAADDMQCVDLGGRRIIKKKKQQLQQKEKLILRQQIQSQYQLNYK
eukprot:TRINITY_DN9214_c0_g1_i1.p3 TRINITY_DN9214_c0_g1~~TRINITY_DN9214_c0_g1_i1.p3  ORF type:complete len:153 (-),score=6.99 TRINITY_DN9214_c0_g1_i1:1-459(-)